MSSPCAILVLCLSIVIIDDTAAVIDGLPAYKGQFKYQVVIHNRGRNICGGAIISASHVLTAEHCVFGWPVAALHISAGMVIMDDPDRIDNRAKRIHTHPTNNVGPAAAENYNGALLANRTRKDIAIIELEHPFDLVGKSDVIAKISLPIGEPYLNLPCFFAGWGNSRRGTISEILRWTTFMPISNAEAGDISNLIRDFEFGIRDPFGVTTVGPGDSGSALNCNGELIGIAVGSTERRYISPLFINVYKFWDFMISVLECSVAPFG